MEMCVGGLWAPAAAQLGQSGAAALEEAARKLLERRPQVIAAVVPGGDAAADAVVLHAAPRVKGDLTPLALDGALGFETEALLTRSLFRQAQRLGVPAHLAEDELAAPGRSCGELAGAALLPLYLLRRAGYREQLAYVEYGALPEAEMYTLGKAIQLAAAKVQKRTALLAAANLEAAEDPWQRRVLAALRQRDVKSLLTLAQEKPDGAAADALRAGLFLLGGLSGARLEAPWLERQECGGRTYWVGLF